VADTSTALGAELFSIYRAGSETIPRVAALDAGCRRSSYRDGSAVAYLSPS
jgi:hypothetical protein